MKSVPNNVVCGQERSTASEATSYFQAKYPGIQYIPETDSFLYRDIEFNYFLSGIGFSLDGSPASNSYILTDKHSSSVWLFTYGDAEERWQDFLRMSGRLKPSIRQCRQRNWLSRLLGL